MNEEIKEIKHRLQLLHAECNSKAREEDINYTLDLITNLQQENERLKFKINSWQVYAHELEDYKSRCEKAIEYINKNKKVVSKYEANDTRLPLDTFMWGVDNLLNILQNGSEEK